LLFYYNAPSCDQVTCPTGFHYYWDYAAETEFSFESISALDQTGASCLITRGDGGTKAFFGVNAFVTLPDQNAAKSINTESYLNSRIDACSALNDDLDVNLILVDFWNFGDVLEVTQTRNAALVAERRARNERKDLRAYT
jgi:hypothetical protein